MFYFNSGPEVVNFQWKDSSLSKIKASVEILALCNVDRVRVELVNGTTSTFVPGPNLNIEMDLETAMCTGQDMTIYLEDYSGKKLFTHTYPRGEFCTTNLSN